MELLVAGIRTSGRAGCSEQRKLYEFTQIELAQKYIHDLPQGSAISICAIDGLSTKDEAKEAEKCLQREDAKSVLIVTSDFHTRRALEIFRREFPGREFSVAAARNDEGFGTRWWTHRQWAKTFVDEWLRLIWWKVVDQWRLKGGNALPRRHRDTEQGQKKEFATIRMIFLRVSFRGEE